MNPAPPHHDHLQDFHTAILQALSQRDMLTFPEFLEVIPEALGDSQLFTTSFPYHIIWEGLNPVAMEALIALMADEQVTLAEVDPILYANGRPQMESGTFKEAYEDFRWVPCVIKRDRRFKAL